MRMLNDSPTVVIDASSPAPLPPPPLLTPAAAPWMISNFDDDYLQKSDGWSERDVEARMYSALLFAAFCVLASILCPILTFVLDGCCTCTEDDVLAPSPPHAAAAATAGGRATAAGGRATDAWLNKRGLRRIPVVVYEAKPGASATETDDCVICLGEFDDGDELRVLPRCHHAFHVQCIDPWLATHPSCLTCRDSLLIQQCRVVTPATATPSVAGEATTAAAGEET